MALPALAADRPLSLTTGMREPWTTPDNTGFTDLLVAELARRLGLPIQLSVNVAAARAISLANDGVDDGLAARVAGLEANYPNLIRVAEPIFVNDFVACANPPAPTVAGWPDLGGRTVAHIIGWQIFERNLPPTADVTTARDSPQLLSLLQNRRAEVILHERWQALWQADRMDLTIAIAEPPLAQVPMYLYLHRDHAALAEPISAALAAMKADGTHRRLQQRAFAGLTAGR